MKKIILFILMNSFSSCIAQKDIKSLSDKNIIRNMISQFSEKAALKNSNSIFAVYFQEKPKIIEVDNNVSNENIYNGFNITVYNFKDASQINSFVGSFDIYKYSENIFCIFNKGNTSELLMKFKKNKLSQPNICSDLSDGYDPKSWVLSFDLKGKLEKCSPYPCN